MRLLVTCRGDASSACDMFGRCLSEIRSSSSAWSSSKLPLEIDKLGTIFDELSRLCPQVYTAVAIYRGNDSFTSQRDPRQSHPPRLRWPGGVAPSQSAMICARNSTMFDQRKPMSSPTLKTKRRCHWDFQGLRCLCGASQSRWETSRVVADRHCQSRRSLLAGRPREELCDSL